MSGRAKALVKKWKQLLPDAQDSHPACESAGQRSYGELSAGQRSYEELRTEGHNLAMRGLEEEDYTGGVTLARPTIRVESGESGGGNSSAMDVISTAMSTPHSHKKHHKDKEKKKKKKKSSLEQYDDGSFSRALEVPLKVHGSRHKKEREERAMSGGSPRKSEESEVMVLGVTPGHRPEQTRKLIKERSPVPTSKLVTAPAQSTAGVKRKGV